MNETIKEIQLHFDAACKFVRPIVIGMVQALLGILTLALIAGVVWWAMLPVPGPNLCPFHELLTNKPPCKLLLHLLSTRSTSTTASTSTTVVTASRASV